MKKLIIMIAIFMTITLQPSLAQVDSTKSYSIFTGGFVLKNSLLSTTKFGYESGHLGFIADLTYDNYRETWNDGSRSVFALFALSGSGRYYLKPLGRSFFGELNFGIALPQLTTTTKGKDKNQSGTLAIIGYGLGWRFGTTTKGFFGEIGIRTSFALSSLHLFTTEQKPTTDENISYQSWLFAQGKESNQLYIGFGYSF